MASSQTLYHIVITNSNSTSAPDDGFVDNLKIQDYGLYLDTSFFTGSISTTTLTVSAMQSGFLQIGQTITGSGVTGSSVISALVTGTGGVGTYTLSESSTVSGEALVATSGLTYALCEAKRRGNVRYREIIDQISMITNAYVTEQAYGWPGASTAPSINSNATALTEASSFGFYIIVEHGDASLSTPDEYNAGQFLTSTACLQRCVGRALLADIYRKIDIFDPTQSESVGVYGATTSIPRFGMRIVPSLAGDNTNGLEIGPYATSISNSNSLVAVTQITF